VTMSGILIRIPTPLRRVTNGQSKVEVESGNLGEIIERMESDYPGFKERLVDEDGELRYFVNIYLNGEDVRFLQGMETTTKTGDELSIVPAVAGGY
jgi:molybdopterin synthase sulfur carrier subunit